MSATADTVTRYVEAQAAVAARLPGQGVAWLRDLRAASMARFAELGFPTTRHEDWKYTNLAPLARYAYTLASEGAPVARAELPFPAFDACRLVFVDGCFAPALSTTADLPAGVMVTSLAAVLDREPKRVEAYLAPGGREDQPFAALNTAFLADGAYVQVGRGVVLERPIHLLFLAAAPGGGVMIQPRNLVVAEEGSRAVLVEHYLGSGDAAYFTNALTQVLVHTGARLEHYRLQQQGVGCRHLGMLRVRLGQDSRFVSHAVDLGGSLVRQDLECVFADEGAECQLNGLYVVDGRGHVDNHTVIDHAKPRGLSREFYKGVLGARARAVFNGRIVVRPDAQHTDAQQMNNNLLLSEDAEIDTKPQLEIYADDVKCSHGATVGSLDADALFYLRSRAIDEAAARDLLTYAFAHDVLARMRLASVRESLERALTTRLLAGRRLAGLELL